MLFSSIPFIFYFLPAVLLAYLPFRKNLPIANAILLVASLLFYAWGEPVFVVLMLCSILLNYSFGLLIDRYKAHASILLAAGVSVNLGILLYFKYVSFLIANAVGMLGLQWGIPDITLPLGISFFTFQAISYLVDLKRNEIKVQKNLSTLALYIAIFPPLIAGPIVRYHDVEQQLTQREITLNDFADGARRFIVGLGKKVLIANTFAQVADDIFALPEGELTSALVMIAVLAYTIQIYFDFSGYSDMALGLGRMFGFKFKENFNYPYISHSIQEFWRRWHISLSSFLRDYLYIPLGGSRCSTFNTYRNLMIVFVLCGLWHGAGWNFILWGAYFGAFLILERVFSGFFDRIPKALSWVYAIIVVMFGWLLFRAENMTQFTNMVMALGDFNGSDFLKKYEKDTYLHIMLACALIGSTPLVKTYFIETPNARIAVLRDIFLMLVMIVCVASLAAGTYNPFIYFRF